ncbi:MAG: hypothetical protein PHI88_03405, partial [Candidatus Pacebacteria bacterium]|nr:hypothetical protein [Candidatus Paceibacterota bacterium]
MLNLNRISYSKKSFTLIELLTAMAVFIFLITATMGIYVTTIHKHFQAQKIQTVSEELRYAMDLISRDIKNSYVVAIKNGGEDYQAIWLAHLTKMTEAQRNTCLASPSENNCLVYRFNYRDYTGNSCRGTQKQCIDSKEAGATETYAPLISSRIKITLQDNCPPVFFYDPDKSEFRVSVNPLSNAVLVEILIVAQATNDTDCFSSIPLKTSVTQKEIEN